MLSCRDANASRGSCEHEPRMSESIQADVNDAPPPIVHCNMAFAWRDGERRCFGGRRGKTATIACATGACEASHAERTAALAVYDALQYSWNVLRECKPRRGPSKGTSQMANPWLKKNPLMSIWLSAANAAAGRARSAASAEASKQQAALTKQTVRFWTGAWQAALKPRRRR